ncbi:AHH domain-containing protein [Myxococcus sp. AM011]|uniref:AHH domain-containing protein n=1 Tax=Myxococcus sp. AM011 TaxID=2745200 RepID=UPI0015959B74|nr:AHH domain-containing protein [Myxococcus sp. AM011]NVJ23730.1 AHH domain-containing protein [Myxococcus sp. AM011]
MPKKPEHLANSAEDVLHKQVDGAEEGGACLTGHSTSYHDACSCTYRWQAVRESRRNRREVYNKVPVVSPKQAREYRAKNASLPARAIPTSYDPAKNSNPNLQYGPYIRLPQPGDWQIFGPTRPDMKDAAGNTIPPGANFTKWTWPYWNNAHHMIPKGTFHATIDAIEDSDCRDLVRVGLLRAEYNVNHHINIILLPMDQEVGRVMELPRHLIRDDDYTGVEIGSKHFNHGAYNQNVRNRLENIIDSFKATIERARPKDCDAWPLIKLSKLRLEALSKHCYAEIIKFGTKSPGAPISDMPPLSSSALRNRA